jgi:hypothetical protein
MMWRATPEPVGRLVVVAVTRHGVDHSDLRVIEESDNCESQGELDVAKRGLKLSLVSDHEIVSKVVRWGWHPSCAVTRRESNPPAAI